MTNIHLSNRFALMVLSVLMTPVLVARADQAQDQSYYHMDIENGKMHVPADGAAGNKTAQLSAKVTVTNQQGPPGNLAGVRFELRDRNGKVAAARILPGPANVARPQPGQAVADFDVVIYDFGPQPGERYMLRGVFPSGRFFGKPVRFEKTAEPLPEEPWETEAAEKPVGPKKGTKKGATK